MLEGRAGWQWRVVPQSEVIRFGTDYPPGGLKARLYVEERKLLSQFCDANDVAAWTCGRIIVACDVDRR